MARTRSPWFAFYADDYIAGTRDMSLAARGAYLDLLCYQFTHGSIPSDERKICRLIGAFPDEWSEIRDEVLEKFEEDEEGNLVNSRMDSEREKREEIRSKRVQAIHKRWNKKNTSEDTSVYTGESTHGDTSTTTTTVETLSPAREGVADLSPTWEQVEQAASNMMIPTNIAERFFDDMEACGWLDAKSRPIRNFQHALKAWATRYQDNEARKQQHGGGSRQNGNRVDRNAGTSNAGRASEYRNV